MLSICCVAHKVKNFVIPTETSWQAGIRQVRLQGLHYVLATLFFSMKFIHTSDWHLGRTLCNRSLLDDQAHVLAQIFDYAVRHQVDALVIAGDIYDRAVPPAAAVRLLNDFLLRMSRQGIPLIMIPGNHDSADRLGFASQLLDPSGIHIIADFTQMLQPVRLETAEGVVCFHGIPYADPEPVKVLSGDNITTHEQAHRYLLERIRESGNAGGAKAQVLISHCFVAGSQESESERPLSVGGADQVPVSLFDGFSYVALGHLHGPQAFREGKIQYSGSPLKYSFSEEKHRKGVVLVEIDAEGVAQTQLLPLTPLHDVRILEGTLDVLLAAAARDGASDDYLLARLTDRHAILDPLGKLRAVYPNMLQIEKPQLFRGESQPMLSIERLRRNEYALFSDFFQQISGQPLSAEQDAAVREVIAHVMKREA